MSKVHSGHKSNRNKGRFRQKKNLEVGRIIVTSPKFGRLNTYLKSDKNQGATFICEQDGGRYGVTHCVWKRFPETGCYDGWAYINTDKTLVFKFINADTEFTLDVLVTIETPDGPVAIPESKKNTMKRANGAIVAFYARLIRYKGASRPRREATDVFLLDDKHLPLIARLISEGRLAFPEHNEVLEFFFDSLPDQQGLERWNMHLFDSALAHLASDTGIPAQFQMLARVERTKLSSAENTGLLAIQLPHQEPKYQKLQEAKSTKPKVKRHCRKDNIVADVMHINLQIEED